MRRLWVLVLGLVALAFAGCAGKAVRYEAHKADGSFEVFEYHNDLFNTSIGEATVHKDPATGAVDVSLKQVSNEARAFQSIDKALERIPLPK